MARKPGVHPATMLSAPSAFYFVGVGLQPGLENPGIPRPGNLLDSALGTFDVENVLKERMHVQPEETRCRGVRRSPGD